MYTASSAAPQSCCPGSSSRQSRTPGDPLGTPQGHLGDIRVPAGQGPGHWKQREQKREGEHTGMLKHLQQSHGDSATVTTRSQIHGLFTGYQTSRVARTRPPPHRRARLFLPAAHTLPCCSVAFSPLRFKRTFSSSQSRAASVTSKRPSTSCSWLGDLCFQLVSLLSQTFPLQPTTVTTGPRPQAPVPAASSNNRLPTAPGAATAPCRSPRHQQSCGQRCQRRPHPAPSSPCAWAAPALPGQLTPSLKTREVGATGKNDLAFPKHRGFAMGLN